MNPTEFRRMAQLAERVFHLKDRQRLLSASPLIWIGSSNLEKLVKCLLPFKAMRLTALSPLPLIGIGTRLLPVSAIMPNYATALTAAVALSKQHRLPSRPTARPPAASVKRSRGQLRLVYSRPSL